MNIYCRHSDLVINPARLFISDFQKSRLRYVLDGTLFLQSRFFLGSLLKVVIIVVREEGEFPRRNKMQLAWRVEAHTAARNA